MIKCKKKISKLFILLFVSTLFSCAKTEDSQVSVYFDQTSLASSARSALVGAIRPTENNEVEVVYVSSFQSIDSIEMNSDLPNDENLRVVLLAFAEDLTGEAAIITNQASENESPIFPVNIYSTPVMGNIRFQAVDASTEDHNLILAFTNMIHVSSSLLAENETDGEDGDELNTIDDPNFDENNFVIDDRNTDYVEYSGNWTPSSFLAGGYPEETSTYHSSEDVNDSERNSWFQWNVPELSGRYQIYAWWQSDPGRPDMVSYEILSDGELISGLSVNQQSNGGQWNLLGLHSLSGQISVRVYAASQASAQGTCADAIRFKYIGTKPPDIEDDPEVIEF